MRVYMEKWYQDAYVRHDVERSCEAVSLFHEKAMLANELAFIRKVGDKVIPHKGGMVVEIIEESRRFHSVYMEITFISKREEQDFNSLLSSLCR